jgi:hypothetical protein
MTNEQPAPASKDAPPAPAKAPEAQPVATPAAAPAKATVPEYKPTEQGQDKLKELLAKREEYTEALATLETMIMQLRYGLAMSAGGPTPTEQCNGFGIGFDMSDYACRELCKKDLHAACKTIVLAKQDEAAKEKERRVAGNIAPWSD